ncbi:MAG: hypothetical protein V3W41_07275 [Planctomycetota bacterium]
MKQRCWCQLKFAALCWLCFTWGLSALAAAQAEGFTAQKVATQDLAVNDLAIAIRRLKDPRCSAESRWMSARVLAPSRHAGDLQNELGRSTNWRLRENALLLATFRGLAAAADLENHHHLSQDPVWVVRRRALLSRRGESCTATMNLLRRALEDPIWGVRLAGLELIYAAPDGREFLGDSPAWFKALDAAEDNSPRVREAWVRIRLELAEETPAVAKRLLRSLHDSKLTGALRTSVTARVIRAAHKTKFELGERATSHFLPELWDVLEVLPQSASKERTRRLWDLYFERAARSSVAKEVEFGLLDALEKSDDLDGLFIAKLSSPIDRRLMQTALASKSRPWPKAAFRRALLLAIKSRRDPMVQVVRELSSVSSGAALLEGLRALWLDTGRKTSRPRRAAFRCLQLRGALSADDLWQALDDRDDQIAVKAWWLLFQSAKSGSRLDLLKRLQAWRQQSPRRARGVLAGDARSVRGLSPEDFVPFLSHRWQSIRRAALSGILARSKPEHFAKLEELATSSLDDDIRHALTRHLAVAQHQVTNKRLVARARSILEAGAWPAEELAQAGGAASPEFGRLAADILATTRYEVDDFSNLVDLAVVGGENEAARRALIAEARSLIDQKPRAGRRPLYEGMVFADLIQRHKFDDSVFLDLALTRDLRNRSFLVEVLGYRQQTPPQRAGFALRILSHWQSVSSGLEGAEIRRELLSGLELFCGDQGQARLRAEFRRARSSMWPQPTLRESQAPNLWASAAHLANDGAGRRLLIDELFQLELARARGVLAKRDVAGAIEVRRILFGALSSVRTVEAFELDLATAVAKLSPIERALLRNRSFVSAWLSAALLSPSNNAPLAFIANALLPLPGAGTRRATLEIALARRLAMRAQPGDAVAAATF